MRRTGSAAYGGRVETLYFDLVKLGYHFALAVLVGGAMVLGAAAAPGIFREVRSRSEAGTAFGAVLERFDAVAIPALLVVAVTTVMRAFEFEDASAEPRIVFRWVALALLGVAVLYGSAWANPVARSIRKQTPAFDELPEAHPVRREFRSLHERSRRALVGVVVFGVIALFLS